MPDLPWNMATITNGQKCMICYKEGKIHSFGAEVYEEQHLGQYNKGFWKAIRQKIVEHYKIEHPEYRITRLNEGQK